MLSFAPLCYGLICYDLLCFDMALLHYASLRYDLLGCAMLCFEIGFLSVVGSPDQQSGSVRWPGSDIGGRHHLQQTQDAKFTSACALHANMKDPRTRNEKDAM